jgi:hypothetical protein
VSAPIPGRAPGRVGCLLLLGAAAGAIWLGYTLLRREIVHHPTSTGCALTAAGMTLAMDTDQAADAATIAAVALRRGLPEQAVVIAFAAAIQESKLENIPFGDRDSVGLFQQRPSQGWGSRARLLDPSYAAGAFYDRLVAIPRYLTMPVADAAQAVQRSGDGSAYLDHLDQADALAAALTGRVPAALLCTVAHPAADPAAARQPVAEARAVEARAVATAATTDFGPLVRPRAGGRGIDLVLTGAGATLQRTGWAVAHWAVAHAARLHLRTVAYAGRGWTARGYGARWRITSGAGSDHVHIDLS